MTDAQSVKNTDTAERKGYDAGKKVSGIKRHLSTDSLGLPIALSVTTANVTDRAASITMTTEYKDGLAAIQQMLVDGGYSGDKFATAIAAILPNAMVTVAKRNELHQFEVIPARWVVERSWAWLEKNRRLWKNCERKLETSKQMMVLAFLALVIKRLC